MSTIREYKNEHGTKTSEHVCETCNTTFTVTPSAYNKKNYENCLSPDCESYDPHRDADILFMSDEEIAKNGKPVSLKMLRVRQKFKSTGEIE